MIDRIAKSPLLLGGAFLLSALLGAGLFALIQAVVPGTSGQARMEATIHDYILEHGELLPQAMDKLHQREIAENDKERQKALAQTPKYIAAHRAEIVNPYAQAVQGNPKATVTISAFLDYNCGYCRASLPALAELMQKDPNVRIVYREYPVLAESSIVAARWALAAAEQGKFPAFHQAMYAAGQVDQASIAAAASKAGLDRKLAEQVVISPRVDKEIEQNTKIASDLGSAGATPLWVVGDKVISGMLNYDQLAAAVADARKGKS